MTRSHTLPDSNDDEKDSAMKHDDKTTQVSRRKFMKSMALTGGGVAVAVTAGQVLAVDSHNEEPVVDQQTGYHETEHIRNYYAKAGF